MESSSYDSPLTTHVLICSIVMGLLGVVGLVLNGAMLVTWVRYPVLRNEFYTVFAALSLADVVFLSVSVPANIIDMTVVGSWMNTVAWCKASRYLIYACSLVTAYLLVVMATLRALLLVNKDIIHRARGKPAVMIATCAVSYVVFFLNAIPILNWHTSHFGSFCFFVDDVDYETALLLLTTLSTFGPLGLVVLVYSIAFVLSKWCYPPPPTPPTADYYTLWENQKFRLVNAVFLAFVLCQIPYHSVCMYEACDMLLLWTLEEYERFFTIKDYLMCVYLVDKVIRPFLCAKLTSDMGPLMWDSVHCRHCGEPFQNRVLIEPAPATTTTTTETEDEEGNTAFSSSSDNIDNDDDTISRVHPAAESEPADLPPPVPSSPPPSATATTTTSSNYGGRDAPPEWPECSLSAWSLTSQTPLVRNHSPSLEGVEIEMKQFD